MSAKQLFIIGAGASNGAAFVHEKYKPPLTPDLPNIFNHNFISLNHSPDGQHIREWFADLLEITGTKNDIEEFFTIFSSLKVVSSKINPKFVFLSDEQIRDLLSKYSFLEQYFPKEEIEIIKKILDYFLRKPKASHLVCPMNLETFFGAALREYLWISITNCNCKYHSLLFSNLTSDDAVVSFNYDSICDFTLCRLGKLTRSSFDGLGFSNVIIFNDKNSKGGVKFLHIHGSFNWWSVLDDNGYNGIYYNLVNENCKSNQIGNTPYPIILPFKQKQVLI